MILDERQARQQLVEEAARQIMIAARTAPKGKGVDVIEVCMLTGEEICQLSDEMRRIGWQTDFKFFLRDADNILLAEAVVLIGTRDHCQGLNCLRCGFARCADRPQGVPCAINTLDVGIAVGSACAMAADLRLDTRVMHSAGMAAMNLGWPCAGAKNVLALPLSCKSKNPFFDRQTTCQPNAELQKYVENEILPKYQSFDAAHQLDHALMVIEQSLRLATTVSNSSRYVNGDGSKTLISTNMMYAIAAYHDLGLQEDRKTHHLVSGRIVREDDRLKEWFTAEQIETMAQAVEDHRASSEHEPRSIYGKIVAEADRLIDQATILRRTLQYGFKHYPDFGKEAHIQRTLDHLDEKYAEGGYLKLWIPESPNAVRLHALQQLIKNRTEVCKLVEEIYEQEINNVKSRN